MSCVSVCSLAGATADFAAIECHRVRCVGCTAGSIINWSKNGFELYIETHKLRMIEQKYKNVCNRRNSRWTFLVLAPQMPFSSSSFSTDESWVVEWLEVDFHTGWAVWCEYKWIKYLQKKCRCRNKRNKGILQVWNGAPSPATANYNNSWSIDDRANETNGLCGERETCLIATPNFECIYFFLTNRTNTRARTY